MGAVTGNIAGLKGSFTHVIFLFALQVAIRLRGVTVIVKRVWKT